MTAATSKPLAAAELQKLDAYWRASNYLSVGQIYLFDNPLLREPLRREHVKPRLLGHWGTTPGLNLLYAHLNRVIARDDLNMIYVIGPGHGGPAIVAHAWLEGTYSEFYPEISQDVEGMKRLFKQFSFPGGIPEPRRAGDARLDPRRRRTRLRALPRVRRRVRQSRSDRGLRRRRRRSRDRTARHRLARQQVPEPGARRRRAADPASQRLQDRQPLLPRAHPEGRAAQALRGLRLRAVLRRGQRSRVRTPVVGGDPRRSPSPRSARSGRRRARAASRVVRRGR